MQMKLIYSLLRFIGISIGLYCKSLANSAFILININHLTFFRARATGDGGYTVAHVLLPFFGFLAQAFYEYPAPYGR
jgi:hypothetical protein